jgi:hypothetical protein
MAARGKLSSMPRIPTGSVYQPKYRDRKRRLVKSKTWWVKYYRPGQAKPVRESANTDDRAEAVEFLRKRMASLTAAETGAEKVTIGQLLDLLVEDWKRRGRKSTYERRARRSHGSLRGCRSSPGIGAIGGTPNGWLSG